jgi:hypothetical protein
MRPDRDYSTGDDWGTTGWSEVFNWHQTTHPSVNRSEFRRDKNCNYGKMPPVYTL